MMPDAPLSAELTASADFTINPPVVPIIEDTSTLKMPLFQPLLLISSPIILNIAIPDSLHTAFQYS
jgi:hypothetical protein